MFQEKDSGRNKNLIADIGEYVESVDCNSIYFCFVNLRYAITLRSISEYQKVRGNEGVKSNYLSRLPQHLNIKN